MMNMKSESIFTTPEVSQYIASSLYKNIYSHDNPINYQHWGLAFAHEYKALEIKKSRVIEEQNVESKLINFVITSSNKHPAFFFRDLFKRLYKLEIDGFVESSDDLMGNMLAWMLDPVRSYYTRENRQLAIDEINSILHRHHRTIKYSDALKKYTYREQADITPTDPESVYFYNERIFITKQKLYYRKDNTTPEPIKTKPTDTRILAWLIKQGKGNIDNWFKTKYIAERLNIKPRTVSNSLSVLRNVSTNNLGIDLVEDRGQDAKGKEYRINPKVL